MHWRILRTSWNPKQYAILREQPLPKIAALIALATLVCMSAFTLLLLPIVAQSDTLLKQVTKTTNLTLDAELEQSAPTYVLRNPDIIITTQTADAFVTITPEALVVKRFLFFGTKSYEWESFSQLDTMPARAFLLPLAVFLVPSVIFWGTLIVTANIAAGTLLFVLVASLILQARHYAVRSADIAKVAMLATVPSLCLGAVLPVLRLGLPLSVLVGFIFVLWITFALLGLQSILEKPPVRYSNKR